MLDVPSFKEAMAEAARIMPQMDIQQAMARDPATIFGFQRGSQLIPYDDPRPEAQQQEEGGDDEYGAYYKW